MIGVLQRRVMLLVFSCLLLACSLSKDEKKKNHKVPYSSPSGKVLAELTTLQQSAFDALNTLQTSTDEMNRLYSTFANIDLPCYPADTSFEISQAEFKVYLEHFIFKQCQDMAPELQQELASSSVLAQDKYTVLHCPKNVPDIDYSEGIPMNGMWILPSILERRNLILVW